MTESELSVVRRAFAKQIMLGPPGCSDQRIEHALSTLPRESFLGPGPWEIMHPPSETYQITPDDDPVYLYQDVMVGIKIGKILNNGRPSFLAYLISLGKIREGEHVVHIGAGLGHYTALIACLVGSRGKVTAIEYEEDLAARAARNLTVFPQVDVIDGDGVTLPLEPADVIFVNAGTARPANTWLDAMNAGARLILPLTVDQSPTGGVLTKGAFFLIERNGDAFFAQWKCPTGSIPAWGAETKFPRRS